MKQLNRITFSILFSIGLINQTSAQVLPSFIQVVERHANVNHVAHLVSRYGSGDYVQANMSSKVLTELLTNQHVPDSVFSAEEKLFLSKNLEIISNFYSKVTSVGGESAKFKTVHNKKDGFVFPIFRASIFRTDTVIIITGLEYKYIFNKSRTSEQERIDEVLNKVSIPFIFYLKELLKISSVNKFCILSSSQNRDFSDRFDSESSETIALLLSREKIERFISAEISEKELLGESDVFFSNSSADFFVKKIN